MTRIRAIFTSVDNFQDFRMTFQNLISFDRINIYIYVTKIPSIIVQFLFNLLTDKGATFPVSSKVPQYNLSTIILSFPCLLFNLLSFCLKYLIIGFEFFRFFFFNSRPKVFSPMDLKTIFEQAFIPYHLGLLDLLPSSLLSY